MTPDCPICDGPIACSYHETCEDCGAALEPNEQVARGYPQNHEMLNCETFRTYRAGAAVAFGLMGMAEAIRRRPCCPHGHFYPAECLDCYEDGEDT